MDVRAAAWVFLLLVTTKGMATAAPASPAPVPRAGAAVNQAELFSRRARRRAMILLRLRWEELRMADLERARAAIRRQIPVDALLRPAGPRKR